jgi:hypothetical protein
MHRRDVLKGLATLPWATALVSCEREKHEEHGERKEHLNTLEVHLDGAFAVVIQENKANSILAFSPRPKQGDEPHQFYLNGYPKAEDSQKSYHFTLSAETRNRDRDSKIEISPGLKDFSFETQRWRVRDPLLTLELPAPDRITFSGHRSPVRFQVSHQLAFMPTNHILEYDLKDAKLPKIECSSEPSLKCEPSRDSFPGVTRFFFEIGPRRSLDLVESRLHAVGFFNYMLQQCFLDLAEKYQLDPEYARKQEYGDVAPKSTSAVYHYGFHDPLLRDASYAVDCEHGGLLASTKTLPLNP